MNYHQLDEYDIKQLQKAKAIIEKIYFYHYGDSYMQCEIKRLETILNKINFLIEKKEREGHDERN